MTTINSTILFAIKLDTSTYQIVSWASLLAFIHLLAIIALYI